MNLYLLNAVLQKSEPAVWRKIVLHPETPFPQLASVLFAAFGWREENERHHFKHVQTGEIFDPESEDIFNDDYHDVTIDWPLSKTGQSLLFVYNRPADDHILRVTLEEIFRAEPESEWPRVVGGANDLHTGGALANALIDLAALNADIAWRAELSEAEYFFEDDDDDDFDFEDFEFDLPDFDDDEFDDDELDDDFTIGHHRSDN